jgi:hypothetical protein
MLPPAPLVLGRTEQEKKSAKHNLKIKGAPNSVRIAYSHREERLYISSIFLQLSLSPPPPNKYICLTNLRFSHHLGLSYHLRLPPYCNFKRGNAPDSSFGFYLNGNGNTLNTLKYKETSIATVRNNCRTFAISLTPFVSQFTQHLI